jgi:hypothetical protein
VSICLRLLAVAIAIAGVIDPVITRRAPAPLSVMVEMPSGSDPNFARALARRSDVVSALDKRIVINGIVPARATIAIGNTEISNSSAPVFAIPVQAKQPSVSIVDIQAPRHTVPGQAAAVAARVRALGVGGRVTRFSLELVGVEIAKRDHTWTKPHESFDLQLSFAPPSAGVHRVRLLARTDGVADLAVADAVVVTRAQPLRVLAFEPRPSWPLTFVRRSLEGDPLFEVAFASRTSRPAMTTSGPAPRSLQSLDVERFDVVIAGALDDLGEAEVRALDRFVTERGGTLVLLPDRRIPETIRRRFDLPRVEEVLIDSPLQLEGGIAPMRASELLLMPLSVRALASARQGKAERTVIGVLDRGAGRVVVSGALDAWRYRADQSGAFDALWRAIVADGALASSPPIDIALAPQVARPGDRLQA